MSLPRFLFFFFQLQKWHPLVWLATQVPRQAPLNCFLSHIESEFRVKAELQVMHYSCFVANDNLALQDTILPIRQESIRIYLSTLKAEEYKEAYRK